MSDVRSDMSTERRASDRRRTETEAMRTNPEVMGRSEPVDMDRSIRPQPQPDRSMQQSDGQLSFWPEMATTGGGWPTSSRSSSRSRGPR
jgi:hypothetical protein